MGLADGDHVDLIAEPTDSVERIVRNFRVTGYSFANGGCAASYPKDQSAGTALRPRPPKLHAGLQARSDQDHAVHRFRRYGRYCDPPGCSAAVIERNEAAGAPAPPVVP